MIRVDVSALDRSVKRVRQIGDRALDGLAHEVAVYLAQEATERTPVDTGALRASWMYSQTGRHSARVENPVRYASFVEFGRRNRGGGAFVPGQKFMTGAIVETEEAVPQMVEGRLRDVVGGVFRG